MGRTICFFVGLAELATLLAVPCEARAQGIVQDALAILPTDTARFEYSNPARLRELTNYVQLRDRYLSQELKGLESSLEQLGVKERDIKELVLGWGPAGGGTPQMDGLAEGEFDSQTLAARARERGISAVSLDNATAYCFDSGTDSLCVMSLKPSVGAFGTLADLYKMAMIQAGKAQGLATNSAFAKLVEEGKVDAPIWGVAVGPTLGDWFKGWMPGRNQAAMDWNRTFQGVEALTYSVRPTDRLSLDANFECTSESAATSLGQLLGAVKAFQQLTWQGQFPNRPNPYNGLRFDVNSRRVHVALTAGYEELLPTAAANP